ncbi:MAG: phosphotransferase family protein [Halobacteriaceae archaeon]
MEGLVTAIVGDAMPGATVEAMEPTRTGNFKQTVVVRLATEDAVVVQYRDLDHGSLQPEARVSQVIARETSVPVPTVIAVGEVEGHSYIVTRRVPGDNLHRRFEGLRPAVRTSIARTLGRYLGELHATFTFEDYGTVTAQDGGLATTDDATDWRSWVRSYARDGLQAMTGPLTDLIDPIETAIEDGITTVPPAPTPRFYPWDYRPGNVLLAESDRKARRGHIAAVLDWGDPLAAHRELSLAKAEFLTADWYADPQLADRLRDAFYQGYEREMSLPVAFWDERRRLYRLIAIVRSSVDSAGSVTRPRYPMIDEDAAVTFHRRQLEACLS